MSQFAAIAIGGALGAVARYWLSTGVYALWGREFPWGTLAVNVVGSALMGLVLAYLLSRSAHGSFIYSLVIVGFLGAFTTFSTFSLETLSLLEGGHVVRALSNVLGSVVLCLLACWAGITVGRQWFPLPG